MALNSRKRRFPARAVMCFKERTDSKYFLIFYAITAYFFSLKMVRLIVLMGPIASALGGLAISSGIEWSIAQAFNHADGETSSDDEASEEEEEVNVVRYIIQPLVELYGDCMVVLKVS
jgi:hypothetical protein